MTRITGILASSLGAKFWELRFAEPIRLRLWWVALTQPKIIKKGGPLKERQCRSFSDFLHHFLRIHYLFLA